MFDVVLDLLSSLLTSDRQKAAACFGPEMGSRSSSNRVAVLPNVHPQNVKRLATQGEAERSRFAASRRKLNGDPHHLPQLCSPPRAQRAPLRVLQEALLRARLPEAALEGAPTLV